LEKRIIISQESESVPITVEIIGDWKAKEINRVERLIIINYRRQKSAIRKARELELKTQQQVNLDAEQKEE